MANIGFGVIRGDGQCPIHENRAAFAPRDPLDAIGLADQRLWIPWMSGLLLTSVEGLELLSDNYGVNYGINIHGWSRRMDSQRKDIYEILGDLYIKYNKQGSSYSPEIRLLFILLSSLLGTQLGNMNKESDIQRTKSGVNAKSDIEMMREKAKQESMYGNTVMQETINKEH